MLGAHVPVGLIGLALAVRLVTQVRAEVLRALDGRGFLLTGLGLSLLIFGLTLAGGRAGNPALAAGMMTGGTALLALYVWHACRTAHPIIDLGLLSIASFCITLLGGVLFRLSVGAIPFLLPLMLQVGFGLRPLPRVR